MSYDFSFDKKSVFLIVGGCVAIGVLLFFAGFVVGWDRGSYQARLEFQKQPAPVVAEKLPPPAADTTTGKAATASNAEPAQPTSGQESSAAVKGNQPSPVAAGNDSQTVDAKPSQAQAAPPKPASDAAPSQQDDPATEAEGFSLQVGAFQNEVNAQRCQNSLKSRGYSVFVFHTLDAGGRSWHAVRIGKYTDIKKASQAAVAFTGKEKLPVFIRPVNEL